MANTVQFSIDDTSPTVSYFPFGDTFSLPSLNTGWNPFFFDSGFATAPGEVGIGVSQHITSLNGAFLDIRWKGTAIQLFGNTTRANFSLTLDGVDLQPNSSNPARSLLASIDGLADSNHSLTLTAITPEAQDPPDSSLVVFDKAVVTSPPPMNFSDLFFTDHVLDDNDVAFQGRWSFQQSGNQVAFHRSVTQGDRASATFSGVVVVRIFGTTSPSSGNYSVILDSIQSPIMSARSSFTNDNTLLYYASGLDPNVTHHVIVRNEGGLLQIRSGGLDVFASGEPTSLPPNSTNPTASPSAAALNEKFSKGTIAAFALAGILAFILLSAILFFLLIWRPRRKRRRFMKTTATAMACHPKEQEAGIVLDISPQQQNAVSTGTNDLDDDREHRDNSGKSGFARWKQELEATPKLTGMGIKFRHSDSVDGGKFNSPVAETAARRPRNRVNTLLSSLSSSSSGRSNKNKKTANKGKANRLPASPWSATFPFKYRSHPKNRASAGSNEVSLSEVTSLSYASNPDLTAYLDPQPPSYAASVSHTSSGSSPNSPPSFPRSVTQTSQSNNQSQPPSPQESRRSAAAHTREDSGQPLLHEHPSPRRHSEEEVPPVPSIPPHLVVDQEQSKRTNREENGNSISAYALGVAGESASVGSPISMHAALRGLSPRISKSRHREKREKRQHHSRPKPEKIETSIPLSDVGPRSDALDDAVPRQGTSTSSPIRALPPLPVPTSSRSSPTSKRPLPPIRTQSPPNSPEARESEQEQTNKSEPETESSQRESQYATGQESFLSVQKMSPLDINFDLEANSRASATEKNRKSRTPTVVGVNEATQSFAGAGLAVGNTDENNADKAEESFGSKRQSTASRVRFEDELTTTTTTTTTDADSSSKSRPNPLAKGEIKIEPLRRHTLQGMEVNAQGETSIKATEVVPEAAREQEPESGAVPTSFIDFSNSRSGSLHSRRTSQNAADTGRSTGRIWSMQLPGRGSTPPPQSRWSGTTPSSHEYETVLSSDRSHSDYRTQSSSHGSPARSSIFPFPISIPPSPFLPEGFKGIEPPPLPPVPPPHRESVPKIRIQTQSESLPSNPSSPASRLGDTGPDPERDIVSQPTETVDSPTDSFPYSVSEVHFRTSFSESDTRLGHGVTGSSNNTPLPAQMPFPLTPQRFQPQEPASTSTSQTQRPYTPTSIVQRVFGGSTSRKPMSSLRKPP